MDWDGNLWEDADFKMMKLDKFGINVNVLSGAKRAEANIQSLARGVGVIWFGEGKYSIIHATRLVKKHVGLQWLEQWQQ